MAILSAKHDPTADALYIRLSDKPYAYGKDLDWERRIDYAVDGTPIGVELLSVSDGVDLHDLPQAAELAEVLERHHIPVFA